MLCKTDRGWNISGKLAPILGREAGLGISSFGVSMAYAAETNENLGL